MPQGVGEKHADDVMPEDLRPEDIPHGLATVSPPPSLPPVDDEGEQDEEAGHGMATTGLCLAPLPEPIVCRVCLPSLFAMVECRRRQPAALSPPPSLLCPEDGEQAVQSKMVRLMLVCFSVLLGGLPAFLA